MTTVATLRQARLKANISQEAVASFIGVSRQEICRYERGKRRPSPERLGRWAQFLWEWL